jgi:hypothetical protein
MKPPDYLKRMAGNKGMAWDAKENILEVDTPHALIQAVGYLKYARREQGPVLFRGQNRLFPTMLPSLFRGVTANGGKASRDLAISEYVAEAVAKKAFIGKFPEYVREPLLQHYGIRTRWLDLVDNAWNALWFACQESLATGPLGQYLHFAPSQLEDAYIVLLQGGAESTEPDSPGLLTGKKALVIDLRRAAPSTYLRPHAQHALLMRRKAYPDVKSMDLSEFVVGVIKIKTSKARMWFGHGELMTTHHVFPPPYYDAGYRTFLQKAPMGNSAVGSIHHVGA